MFICRKTEVHIGSEKSSRLQDSWANIENTENKTKQKDKNKKKNKNRNKTKQNKKWTFDNDTCSCILWQNLGCFGLDCEHGSEREAQLEVALWSGETDDKKPAKKVWY